MSRKAWSAVFSMALGMAGCTDPSADDDEALGSRASALLDPNLLDPNALDPNALDPNALDPNALDPNLLDPNALDPNGVKLITSTMKSLKRADLAGTRSRQLMQYIVECAYAAATPKFTFSWVDSASVTHNESWPDTANGRPAMGLAPSWRTTKPLPLASKQLITACVASRVNATGTSIMLSSRGSHAALTLGATEKNDYTQAEGTFWGNGFDGTSVATDYWYACEASKACRLDVANSTYHNRVCANADPTKCGPITKLGYCGDVCETYVPDPGYWTNCHKGPQVGGVWPDAANANTITTWLAKPAYLADNCKVTQVASSSSAFHACALRGTGDVVCWGVNTNGQLGTDTKSPRSLSVVSIPTAIQVATSSYGTCVLKSSGSVNCWGANDHGELGIGTRDTSVHRAGTNADVTGLTDAKEITGGVAGFCARRATGAVVCWGYNTDGCIGNGTQTPYESTPKTVLGLADAVQISSGKYHTCALRATGAVMCWGYNTNGEVGSSSYGEAISTPITVSGLSDVVEVVAGTQFTCARRSTGEVSCFGINNAGQLGNNTQYVTSSTPVAVSGLTDAVGLGLGDANACAVRANGTVVCWGENRFGKLGNGSAADVSLVPVPVSGVSDAVEIAVAWHHACARTVSGRLACWGYNGDGEVGDDTITHRSQPVSVNGAGNLPPRKYDDHSGGTISSSWTVAGGTWTQGGGVFKQASATVTNRKVAALSDQTYPKNVKIRAKVRVDSWAAGDSARVGVVVNANTSNQGYALVFHNTSSTVQFLNDGATPVWGNSYAFSWTLGKWYWFELQHVDGVLYGKVWAENQKEPRTWSYTQTGWSSHNATGRPGLYGGGQGTGASNASFKSTVVR